MTNKLEKIKKYLEESEKISNLQKIRGGHVKCHQICSVRTNSGCGDTYHEKMDDNGGFIDSWTVYDDCNTQTA